MVANRKKSFEEEIEAELANARRRSYSESFLFRLGPGEKALVRLLVPFEQQKRLDYHERFNTAENKMDANGICASEVGQECAWCAASKDKKDTLAWKLKPIRACFLPVYVHSIQKKGEDGQWAKITYTDENGDKRTVCGERMLYMKLSSSMYGDFYAQWRESSDIEEERNISHHDFVITRNGKGKETTYTVTPKPMPLALPTKLQPWTQDRIFDELVKRQPPNVVGAEVVEDGDGQDLGDMDDVRW